MPESIESSKLVSHRARMSGEFDSRKDDIQQNWNEGLFTELCGSELSGLLPFDNMAIIHWVKNGLKTER